MNTRRFIGLLLVLAVIAVCVLPINGASIANRLVTGQPPFQAPAAPAATEPPAIISLELQTAGAQDLTPTADLGTADIDPDYDEETQKVKELTGLDVQRFSTKEVAMWVHRAAPGFVENVKCPQDYVCTADAEVDGMHFIALWDGGPNVVFDKVYAITIRYQPKYPADDPVNTLTDCRLLVNENLNGRNEVPSFTVLAGNFSCSNPDATVMSLLPEGDTTLSCPLTAQDASTLLTGTATNSSSFTKREGHWYIKAGSQPMKVTLPFGNFYGWNGAAVELHKAGESADGVTEGTYYCS